MPINAISAAAAAREQRKDPCIAAEATKAEVDSRFGDVEIDRGAR